MISAFNRARSAHSVTPWRLTTHSWATNSWRTGIITCAGPSYGCHRSFLIWLQRSLGIWPVGTSCRPRRPNGSEARRVNLCSVSVLLSHSAAAENSFCCMLSGLEMGDRFEFQCHQHMAKNHTCRVATWPSLRKRLLNAVIP